MDTMAMDGHLAGGARLPRRAFVRLGVAGAALALLPATAAAAPPGGKPGGTPPTPLQDPYNGRIPLIFPVADGAYRKPLRDNWHDNREGGALAWSHENGSTQRAHDGVDIFPRFATQLPTVYAPLAARVAAVRFAGGAYTQNPDLAIAPPHGGYAAAPEIYGSYLWLYSTDPRSAGYFVFYCHLRTNDPFLSAMADKVVGDDGVTTATAVGTLGDTGNAAGQPQLHMELHLPGGQTFGCIRCLPSPRILTAANPFPSLSNAAPR